MINHEIKGNISTITLDNPRIHNAFSGELIKQFIKILEEIDKHKKIKVVVLRASGPHFSSGADLKWMESMSKSTEEVNREDALLLAQLLHTLNTLKIPCIARVQGNTFGGAIGLLACCDIVIAEENAIFSFSEVKLGLIPATIAPYVIHCMGPSAARYYFMTAQPFSADAAQRLQLVHHVCRLGTLNNALDAHISALLQNGPKALSAAKQLIHKITPIDTITIEKTASWLAEIRCSPEGQEGIQAFLEKRRPAWSQTPL